MDTKQWRELKDLGNRALFVSDTNYSMSVTVADGVRWKSNCIYCTRSNRNKKAKQINPMNPKRSPVSSSILKLKVQFHKKLIDALEFVVLFTMDISFLSSFRSSIRPESYHSLSKADASLGQLKLASMGENAYSPKQLQKEGVGKYQKD
ncbi:hypothetical protein RJ639_020675 [Escallonia herrerae]|uniref:KIB1-4 beta-propeller domain-containing protein n=1 Tax=Escallonia herrerae TaxID=1293975 RepID=A0AA88V2Y4_9ASTE|nr:hypothetical protein RJ639_020675 [Escallonia herrerae]